MLPKRSTTKLPTRRGPLGFSRAVFILVLAMVTIVMYENSHRFGLATKRELAPQDPMASVLSKADATVVVKRAPRPPPSPPNETLLQLRREELQQQGAGALFEQSLPLPLKVKERMEAKNDSSTILESLHQSIESDTKNTTDTTNSTLGNETLSNSTGHNGDNPLLSFRNLTVPDIERNIMMVHVGKAGGVSFRRNLANHCFVKSDGKTNREEVQQIREECFAEYVKQQKKLIHQIASTKLPVLIPNVMHMWVNFQDVPRVLDKTTSFLVTLRHPVDRIVSAYRYGHPSNCPSDKQQTSIGGCDLVNRKVLDNPRGLPSILYQKCFPSAAINEFAQATMDPWSPLQQNISRLNSFTREDLQYCRDLARHMVQGRNDFGANPHMNYNYFYYATNSIYRYPDKEVFAIRTEHEWEDIINLDRLLGGSGGKFKSKQDQNYHWSHGSEQYAPSPVSKEAYYKLCCVLHTEMDAYLDFLDRAQNLHEYEKADTKRDLMVKCGIRPDDNLVVASSTTSSPPERESNTTTNIQSSSTEEETPTAETMEGWPSWKEWKGTCQYQLRQMEFVHSNPR